MNAIKSKLARRELRKFNKTRAKKVVKQQAVQPVSDSPRVAGALDLHDLRTMASAGLIQTQNQVSYNDGNKFFGGFGPTTHFITDYWSLRAKSAQLFTENIYARGIIRRGITNIINTGLWPEAQPNESVIGVAEDSLESWSDDVENRFFLWGDNEQVCDYKGQCKFSKLQRVAKMEAFVTGDVLVVIRQDKKTRMPQVQLISGSKIQSPGKKDIPKGHKVIHGVELDKDGKHVAYWVRNDNLNFNRLPKYGRNGRLNAFLLYGTDKRMDNVRGEPLLSIVLQSLKEIDRYRDSVQRKAVINSMLAMFVTKKEDRPGTKPLGGGAVRKDSTTVTDSDGGTRTFNTADFIPGLVIDELAMGEEIHGFDTSGIDLDFPKFEEAIIQAIAWAMETPPEILKLAFSSNYAASQAANNEYKMFLNKERLDFGNDFCSHIYFEWLLSETLNRKIETPGFLEAWRDPLKYEVYGAWKVADWSGAIKPSTDIVKTGKGYKIQVDENFISRERACREVSGMKLSTVAKKNQKANQQLADSLRPLLELKKELSGMENDSDIEAKLEDMIEAKMDDIAEAAIDTLNSDVVLK